LRLTEKTATIGAWIFSAWRVSASKTIFMEIQPG
jgi:hypothetical protein